MAKQPQSGIAPLVATAYQQVAGAPAEVVRSDPPAGQQYEAELTDFGSEEPPPQCFAAWREATFGEL